MPTLPLTGTHAGNPTFMRRRGRNYGDPSPWIGDCLREHCRPISKRFFERFSHALPELPRSDLRMRMRLSLHSLSGVLATAGIGDLIAALGMRQAISELVLLARLIALVLPMRTTPLGSLDQVHAAGQVAAWGDAAADALMRVGRKRPAAESDTFTFFLPGDVVRHNKTNSQEDWPSRRRMASRGLTRAAGHLDKLEIVTVKMKSKILLLASMVSLGALAATPAFAAHGSPVSTTFSANGAASLTSHGVPITCTSHFVLVTDGSGNVTVTGASFTGSSTCTSLTTSNLPWAVAFASTTSGTIQNVTIGTPLGICQGNVAVAVNNSNSQITISGSVGSSCSASGTLTVSPNFTVVN